MKQFFYGLLFCSLFFSACTENPPVDPSEIYAEGVFTINEGVFGQTSGTITHYNRNEGTAAQKIFKQKNSRDLGDVVQSMIFYLDKAYIVVNNSNKIEVVDANSFEEKAQITGLRLPRYMVVNPSENTAYVSEWGVDGLTGTIAIVDLNTNTVINRISVGVGPEKMFLSGNRLYVAHTGGYATNNIISIIMGDNLWATIPVLDKPTTFFTDQVSVWVACEGEIAYSTYPNIDTANSTESGLVNIDARNQLVLQTISFGKGNPPKNVIQDPDNKLEIYYSRSNKVCKYDIGGRVEETLFNGTYYGLGFDPVTNYIYAATSTGINPAEVQRYDTNGNFVDSYGVGVFANGFVFK